MPAVMTASEAQQEIAALTPWAPPTKEQLKTVEHLRVDYKRIDEMPAKKQGRLLCAINWIVAAHAPREIFLCMSQLNGYPVNEDTSIRDFKRLREVFGSAKFSDWDFVVPDAPRVQHRVHHLLAVDLFPAHHNGVRLMSVYRRAS